MVLHFAYWLVVVMNIWLIVIDLIDSLGVKCLMSAVRLVAVLVDAHLPLLRRQDSHSDQRNRLYLVEMVVDDLFVAHVFETRLVQLVHFDCMNLIKTNKAFNYFFMFMNIVA